MISRRELEDVIGPVSIADTEAFGSAHPSPGMHEKHYSPMTPLLLTAKPPAGRGAYLWWNRENRTVSRSIHMPADPSAYGQALYSILHMLDGEDLEFIAVEPTPSTDEWAAINDRLRRACSHP
jgi:L-threonylcarbamoyladenylate synthase